VPSGRATTRFLGWLLILIGAISQIVSRLLDGNSGDVDDLGRVLNGAGLAVVAVGAFLVTVGGWLYGRPEPSRPRRALQVAAPVVIAVTLTAASLAVIGGSSATASGSDMSAPVHSHDNATATDAASATTVVAGANAQQTDIAAQITASATHEHGVAVPEQPMSDADRATLDDQLLRARLAALRYPTVADAEAGGYRMVTPYLPLIGAHYIRWDLMDATFELARPEMLLYDGTAPSSKIVGLSYYVFSAGEPDVFAGPNDHWHQHFGLCLKDNVVIGPESTPADTCAALGGIKVAGTDGWMIHVWVVPGWESPDGVFAPEHPGLT
jgi:hypothetical protein